MEQTTVSEITKQIRRNFRTRMNGPLSQSMREKGLDYHVNWGIPLPHLQEMAADYDKNLHVALELWKDNVRESKIMAMLLMPQEEFTLDIALLWSEQINTQEIAEMAALLLYQNAVYAPQISFRLLASGNRFQQILALNIISRLLTHSAPDERGLNELLDHISLLLRSDDIPLKHAAHNCLMRLSTAGNCLYESIIDNFLKANNLA